MARRAGTLDPVLAELRAELLHRLPGGVSAMPSKDQERRRMPRMIVSREAKLHSNDLILDGVVLDVGPGGVFFQSRLLIEIGEKANLELDGNTPVAGRVAWLRGPSHPLGPGMGICFEVKDPRAERAALELVLALLD